MDYPGKTVRIKACSANQCSVNVGFPHQLPNVFRFYRTAVDDPGFPGRLGAVPFGQQRTDEPVHFLSLRRRSGLSGTDRPDRLVSDNDTFHIGNCQTVKKNSAVLFLMPDVRQTKDLPTFGRHACRCAVKPPRPVPGGRLRTSINFRVEPSSIPRI